MAMHASVWSVKHSRAGLCFCRPTACAIPLPDCRGYCRSMPGKVRVIVCVARSHINTNTHTHADTQLVALVLAWSWRPLLYCSSTRAMFTAAECGASDFVGAVPNMFMNFSSATMQSVWTSYDISKYKTALPCISWKRSIIKWFIVFCRKFTENR